MSLRQSFLGSRVWMRSAPSMIFTSGLGYWSSFSPASGSRQVMRSDFVVSLISLLPAKAGGNGWFSCSKKVSRSPSLDWQDMYIWENRRASLWCFFFVLLAFEPFFNLHLNRGRFSYEWADRKVLKNQFFKYCPRQLYPHHQGGWCADLRGGACSPAMHAQASAQARPFILHVQSARLQDAGSVCIRIGFRISSDRVQSCCSGDVRLCRASGAFCHTRDWKIALSICWRRLSDAGKSPFICPFWQNIQYRTLSAVVPSFLLSVHRLHTNASHFEIVSSDNAVSLPTIDKLLWWTSLPHNIPNTFFFPTPDN